MTGALDRRTLRRPTDSPYQGDVPMSEAKHYCTGCGGQAIAPCAVCGEWRCTRHLSESCGWCEPDGQTCAKGAFCAERRPGGGEHQCTIVNHGHEGPVRQLRLLARDGTPAPRTAWFCRAWTVNNGGRWRWREEPNTPPVARCYNCGDAGAAPCPRCRDMRCEKHRDHRGYCKMTAGEVVCAPENHPGELSAYPEGAPDRHLAAPAPLENDATRALRKRAFEGDSDAGAIMCRWMKCATWCCVVCWQDLRQAHRRFDGETLYCLRCYEQHVAEQKKVVEGETFSFHVPASDSPIVAHYSHEKKVEPAPTPEPRLFVTYCSSAPPRELVESVLVRCGSGVVGGAPVMAPMVWTWTMKRNWERHEAFRTATYNDEGIAFVSTPAAPVVNGEYTPPQESDVFGGTVPLHQGIGGWRCRLCGAWLRRKEVVR